MSTTTQYPGHAPAVPGPGPTAGGASHAKVAPGEIAVGVVVGRASEYFDFFVFGIACVLVFPKVFFPFEPQLEGTLWAFVIFSFAFIMRPIGTALSMAIQRRWGRATKLTVALFLLGTATVGMAFLPSYNTIGAHAITLLAVFRCLQGLAFGGSWDGLPSLLALNAPPNRRGWYSMMGQLGAPVGFMVASALFHLVTVFPLSWIAVSATQQISDVLIVQIIGAVIGILGTVASGWLADRIGRRTTLGLLAVLIAVFALFTPWLLGGGPMGQDAFILVGFALLGLSYGQASGTVTANFTRRFRYTGAALTSDMAWLIGAAFAPLVALGLSARFGLVAVSIYLLSGAACTLLALRINKVLETRD